jgi:hypothetical protein
MSGYGSMPLLLQVPRELRIWLRDCSSRGLEDTNEGNIVFRERPCRRCQCFLNRRNWLGPKGDILIRTGSRELPERNQSADSAHRDSDRSSTVEGKERGRYKLEK